MGNTPNIIYRIATPADIPAMAKIRAAESGTEDGWLTRITAYMTCEAHPQKALKPRVLYVAENDGEVVGFVAGHLTRRLDCEGELQWINVSKEHRRASIAAELVRVLAKWFVENNANRICVDPDGSARKFYASLGAAPLNNHWLVWQDVSALLQ
jgi:predicted N-acetyltransferase YhbS